MKITWHEKKLGNRVLMYSIVDADQKTVESPWSYDEENVMMVEIKDNDSDGDIGITEV